MIPSTVTVHASIARIVPLLLIVAACSGEADPGEAASEPEYDGLSREQIEMQAEPMTPAEAERLGIVDTTIRIEPPVSPDSVAQDTPVTPLEP